jgi:hypothetical protein
MGACECSTIARIVGHCAIRAMTLLANRSRKPAHLRLAGTAE